ncbi:MAG: DUF167 domain-containing protein [Candidatus Gastranaerophilales bacterium]
MFKLNEKGIILKLKISPNASKNEFIKTPDGLKLKITALPIEGKANKFVIEFLSKYFKIPKSYIEILKGETSKEKTILLASQDKDKIANIIEFINNL